MVKDLNKMLSGAGGMMPGGSTSLKIDMHEYKEMNLSVGDKVYLDLTKDENTGVWVNSYMEKNWISKKI